MVTSRGPAGTEEASDPSRSDDAIVGRGVLMPARIDVSVAYAVALDDEQPDDAIRAHTPPPAVSARERFLPMVPR